MARNILNRNVPLVACMDTTKPPPNSSHLCKLSICWDHMGNIWRNINVTHGLKHESMPCKPCSPINTNVSRHMRVCYCRLNISTKELVLSYFNGDVSDMTMISHVCARYTPSVFVYIHITLIIVMIWLMYKEIVKSPVPIFRSLNLIMYSGCQLDEPYGFPGDYQPDATIL